MSKLGVVEDTLFVPMLGRIYASEHYPQILYDKKALELKKKLPSDLIKQNMQNQYTSVSFRYHIGDRLSPDHSPTGQSHRPVCVPEKSE